MTFATPVGRVARHSARASLLALALPVAAALAQSSAPSTAPTTATQRAPGDTVSLTLEQALARATTQSEEVRLARSQVALAESQVLGARAAALPQVEGNLQYVRTFDSPFNTGGFTLPDSLRFEPDTTLSLAERIRYLEKNAPNAGLGGLGSLFGNLPFGQVNNYTATISGTQPVYSGGRVGAGLRIAREYREAARLGLTEQIADIELQIRTVYYRALLAQELERIAAAAVEQAEAFLAQERLRRDAGTASDLDVLRAEVSLENLRPQLIEARNSASLATLDLKRLVDLPMNQPVRLTTPLSAPSAAELAAPADQTLRLAQRAAVRAAEHQVEIREQQVKVARGGYLPSVDLRVSYGRQVFPITAFDFTDLEWRTDFTASVGVRVPIFNGFRTRAEVQQARITLDQERLRLSQLRENVQLQYEQALGERARSAADLAARQRTVEQAQRVHDLTVLRYQQGLATQLEVTDARLALLQARTNLAQAISSFYLADAGVTRALGLTSTGTPGTPRAP